MSNKMTAHEWEIAYDDLKAENEKLKDRNEQLLDEVGTGNDTIYYQSKEIDRLNQLLGKASATAEGFRKAIEDIWKCPDCDPDFWVCKKHRKYFKKALEEAKPEGSK